MPGLARAVATQQMTLTVSPPGGTAQDYLFLMINRLCTASGTPYMCSQLMFSADTGELITPDVYGGTDWLNNGAGKEFANSITIAANSVAYRVTHMSIQIQPEGASSGVFWPTGVFYEFSVPADYTAGTIFPYNDSTAEMMSRNQLGSGPYHLGSAAGKAGGSFFAVGTPQPLALVNLMSGADTSTPLGPAMSEGAADFNSAYYVGAFLSNCQYGLRITFRRVIEYIPTIAIASIVETRDGGGSASAGRAAIDSTIRTAKLGRTQLVENGIKSNNPLGQPTLSKVKAIGDTIAGGAALLGGAPGKAAAALWGTARGLF